MPPPPNNAISNSNLQHQPPGGVHPHLNQDINDPHNNFQPPPPSHLHHHPQSHIEHQHQQPQLGQYPPPTVPHHNPSPSQSVPVVSTPHSSVITSSSSNVPSAESNIDHIVRTSTFNVSSFFFRIFKLVINNLNG